MLQYLDNKLTKNPCSDRPETWPPLWGASQMIDGGATCPPFNAARRCCVAVNSWLLFYFLFVFTPPDQIYCVISSSTTSKLAHHCQGGNKLEQSLIASGVNGRKWVGCGRKPHIPANCTNAQEANCQFDGMLSLSNWSWANWKNRQKPVWQRRRCVRDCIFWSGGLTFCGWQITTGHRREGAKKQMAHWIIFSPVHYRGMNFLLHILPLVNETVTMLLLKRFYIYLVIYYDLLRRCPLVAAPCTQVFVYCKEAFKLLSGH